MKSSLKLLGAAAVLALGSANAQAQLILSEVVDGSLTGGTPKWVEISNTSGAPIDLSLYNLVYYSNGSTTASGTIPLTPAGLLPAGASWTVVTGGASGATQFTTVYGFAPGQTASFGGHNGDDAIALELVSNPGFPTDVWGVIGCDAILTSNPCGTLPTLNPCAMAPNAVWDYEDSYAYRCGLTENGGVFDPTDWVIPGSEALEDCAGGDPARTLLLQTLTTPGIKQNCTTPPLSYCTAKTTSNGCSPTIGFIGAASATSGSGFLVNGTSFMNNKNCLLFYGVSGQASNPFQGGTLCVKAQVRRTPGTNTLGNPPPNDCSGVPSIDMNLFAVGGLGGTPLAALTVPGTVVDCQWWGRDPGFVAPNNTQLSNALEYTVGP